MGKNLPSSTHRRMPTWASVVLVLVALVIILGLALPYFLDVDRYRTLMATSIEQETGRKATLGTIHARFLPTVGFTVDGVSLSNPRGFPEGELVSVGTLRGRLAWGPLFHRQVQVVSIELVRPKLTLVSDARGRTNYDFSAPGGVPAGHAAAPAKEAGSSSSFSLAEIEKISLTDAEVALEDLIRGKIQPGTSIRGLNLEARHVTFNESMMKRFEGEANLKGVRIQSSSLAAPIEILSGKISVGEGRAQGDFRAKLGAELDVKGALKVADVTKPVVEFDVSTAELDLDAVSNLFSGEKGAAADPPAASAAAPKGESELLARGKLAAERIRFGPYKANNGVVEVRLFTDRIEAFPARMDLYGGTLQIAARGDRTETPLRFSANVKLNNIDVGKFVSVKPDMKGKVTGTLELNLQKLTGSAGARLLDSLNGSGDFAVRDGQLPGFNLPGALASVAKYAGGGGGGSTPFKVIQGDLSIAQGRVSSKQIHMDSPMGTVDLHGSFGFDETVSYEGQATLVPGAAGGVGQAAVDALTGLLGRATAGKKITKATIPFSVGGTFSDMKIRPGKSIPQFETAAPNQTTAPSQKTPSLQDTLKGLFKKP